MNVAVVAPTASSFLTVFPTDAKRPLAASLNWIAGQPPVSNAVTADIAADGRISFYNLTGSVHIAVDIVGYFVDHDHDDRYYTEAEADARFAPKAELTFDGSGLQLFDLGAVLRSGPGCFSSSAPNGNPALLPLTLPVGARITAVHVSMYDGIAGAGYDVRLRRRMARDPNVGQMVDSAIAVANGGGQLDTVVVHTLVPAVQEVVEVGESFVVEVDGADLATLNSFCSVRVTLA